MCSTQPQRGGTAIACPVIEPPSHGATAPGGPITGPALYCKYYDCYVHDTSYREILFLISEYSNSNQLQQDHPCVLNLIRNDYLQLPAPNNLPYRMDHPEVMDPSDGQSEAILKILQNKV